VGKLAVEYSTCNGLSSCQTQDNDDRVYTLTSPIVAPVNRTRKKALVPVAMSRGFNVLMNTW
jgi:hypothetical protein